MIEYKYKKKDNKFTENGHTMFEMDVLRRLQRLADLEEQVKQGQLLPKHLVRISYSDKRKFVKCRNVYKTSWESTTRKVDENCKLHFLSGAEFMYNRVLERLPNEC